MMGYMVETWVEVPHLRCVHVNDKGRKIISLASARVNKYGSDGAWTEI